MLNLPLSRKSLLQKIYHSSSLTFSNFPSTLIPNTFYQEEEKKKVLAFNHEVYDIILTDQLQQIEAVNVYSIPSSLLNSIQKTFPNTQIKCNSTILIEQLLLENDGDKTKVFASVKKDLLEVCIIENKNLAFHNCFDCKTKEDILYYLLFTMEQLGLSAEKTNLILLDDTIRFPIDIQILRL